MNQYKKDIDQLKDDFICYLRGTRDERVTRRFQPDCSAMQIDVKKDLQTVLKESRDRLEKLLSDDCLSNPIILGEIFASGKYRHLKHKYKAGENEGQIFKEFTELFVCNELKFPASSDIINHIDVKLDFYDISDELINDNDDFMKIINSHELKPREVSEGFEVK